MHQSLRVNFASCFLIAAVALAGCSGGNEQQRELDIQVSPDTVRFDPEMQSVPILYTMRSTAAVELWDPLGPSIQTEFSTGSWTTLVESGADVQPCPCGFTISSGYSGQRIVARPLNPGRYRLRAAYRRSDPTNVTAAGASLEAFSNAFVVLP